MRYIYWTLSVATLGLLIFDGPTGSLLTSSPATGKVQRSNTATTNTGPRRNARGVGGAMFLWMGGGYRGGK